MRIIRFLILVLMQFLLFAIGFVHFFKHHPRFQSAFGPWLNPPATPGAFDWRPSPLGIDIFFSFLIALPAIYWLFSVLAYRRGHGTLNVHTHTGDTIQFQLGAIEEFVRTQVRNHPAVTSHAVRVWQDRGGAISVNLGIRVKPIESVPEIHRQVKEVLRDGIVNVLGIDNIGSINVEIKRVQTGPLRQTGPLKHAEPAPEPPVRAGYDHAEAAALVPPAAAAATLDTPGEATQHLEFNDTLEADAESEAVQIAEHRTEEDEPKREDESVKL